MFPPQTLRPGGRSRRGRFAALMVTPVLAALVLTPVPDHGSAAASPATLTGAGAAPMPLPDDIEPVPVTLITGDTVLWYDNGGRSPLVEVRPAERGYPLRFEKSGTQEDFYVIPSDVMEHVVEGRLDRELFNVPGLIRQGLDDASSDGKLPVIVTFDQDGARRSATTGALAGQADALPAAADPVVVERVQSAGVTIDRDHASRFRDAVLTTSDSDPTGRHTTATTGMAADVERIVLDRRLEVSLAQSVPQIGAPQAWESGHTGEGITVAVLDTGVDATHPDLAGQVVAAENFVGAGEPVDDHGHGTHVASTVAGTGAASDGRFTGVAPDADLLSGKVCTADGQCPTSAIMAGMQWAAVDQDADVVNMSLGGGPTDGTDPLSLLVNQLSAETGTLFVIAAGNSGGDGAWRTVGSPAAADSALAVGAVDKSDQMTEFSSPGPRLGDHGFKPEIVAPGKFIIASRAEGTSAGFPVGESHIALSGTSMATPHVAGAAALLAQARPGLTRAELKDALVSTATDLDNRAFQQGTGRVEVPAAISSPVYAQGVLNLGQVEGQASGQVTYTNHSDQDITLSLSVEVAGRFGEPYHDVSLSADTVTVPAGGQAGVTVTATLDVDTADALRPEEGFTGVIAATSDTGVELRTGVGFGPPLNEVTVEVLDSNGNRIGTPTAPDRRVTFIHDTFDWETGGNASPVFQTSEGVATGHVIDGTYTIMTLVEECSPGDDCAGEDAKDPWARVSGLVALEVEVDGDTSIALDARDTVQVEQPDVPQLVDKRDLNVELVREYAGSGGLTATVGVGGSFYPVYVTPTPPGELARIGLRGRWLLAEPQPLHPLPWLPDVAKERCPWDPRRCYSPAPDYIYNVPFAYVNGIPDQIHQTITRQELVAVPTRYHSDRPDAIIYRQFNPIPAGQGGVIFHTWAYIQPGEVTEQMLADDGYRWRRQVQLAAPDDGSPPDQGHFLTQWSQDKFLTIEGGKSRDEERWFEAPIRIGIADMREEYVREVDVGSGGFTAWPGGQRGGPDGNQFGVPRRTVDNSRGHLVNMWAPDWRMWNLDTGTELEPSGRRQFTLPPGEAIYRLEQGTGWWGCPECGDGHYSPVMGPMLRTGPPTTTWTFTSRPSDAPVPSGYRCSVSGLPDEDWETVCQIQPLIQLEYDLGLDIHNRAPAGRAHVFTINAGHHSKAIDRGEIADLSVEASFDDGETWTDARVVGKPKDSYDTGGILPSAEPYQQFRVVLKVPRLHRTNGYVSLRVQAEDSNGGTVEQTTHRAYILK